MKRFIGQDEEREISYQLLSNYDGQNELGKKNYIYVYMPIKIDLDCEKKKIIKTPLPSSPCNQIFLSLGSSLIPRPSTSPPQVEMENKSSSLLFLCFHTFFSFLCLQIVLKYFLSYLKAFFECHHLVWKTQLWVHQNLLELAAFMMEQTQFLLTEAIDRHIILTQINTRQI